MPKATSVVCLDVGEKRIGIAVGDKVIRIAVPFDTVEVNGNEIQEIIEIITKENADVLVIGYPRNQSGEPTKQTEFVKEFANRLSGVVPKIIFQDESLTSVIAEKRLAEYNKPYTKSDIDAQAAAIILQDYLESNDA